MEVTQYLACHYGYGLHGSVLSKENKKKALMVSGTMNLKDMIKTDTYLVLLSLANVLQDQHQYNQSIDFTSLLTYLCSKAVQDDLLDPHGLRHCFWNLNDSCIDLPMHADSKNV